MLKSFHPTIILLCLEIITYSVEWIWKLDIFAKWSWAYGYTSWHLRDRRGIVGVYMAVTGPTWQPSSIKRESRRRWNCHVDTGADAWFWFLIFDFIWFYLILFFFVGGGGGGGEEAQQIMCAHALDEPVAWSPLRPGSSFWKLSGFLMPSLVLSELYVLAFRYKIV